EAALALHFHPHSGSFQTALAQSLDDRGLIMSELRCHGVVTGNNNKDSLLVVCDRARSPQVLWQGFGEMLPDGEEQGGLGYQPAGALTTVEVVADSLGLHDRRPVGGCMHIIVE